MGIINFLFGKKQKEEEATQKKEVTSHLSDSQIRSAASIGFKTDWLSGISNENLFPMAFEWIETSQFTKIFRFKSLRSDKTNYAPTIRLYCETDEFFYDGDWASNQITINCESLGNVLIPYPGKCMVKIIAPYIHFDVNAPNTKSSQVNDFSNILEIDYSQEAIEYGESIRRNIINKEAKEREREEIDDIKSNIKNRKKKRELEKQALQELIDEGEIFPETNKRPPITKEVADTVWNRDCGKCVYCGSIENLHFDHIIPFSKGGDTSVENLQLLCSKCNLSKSNKIG